MNHKLLVLASTSRYRANLLSRLQLPFEIAKPDTDETPLPDETPMQTALRLSIAKAKSISSWHQNALIIGSDQVADLDGKHIGKPETRANARLQLGLMRGKTLIYHSGLALLDSATGEVQSAVIPTIVKLRNYSDTEIEHYLDREDALDCAGGAKSEGLGIALIASMQNDDQTALIGLPLIALTTMLSNAGMKVLA